ncbi:hypothetical protein C8Q74DRAFT_1191671 [Fomes fomentarius]|nr:hypothetical protein C8Q74DRAFT_1191671 [Fomes fomentarius]
MCTKILPSVPPDSCPPLPVILYAIRAILEPSFVLQEIPNLLRLLVHLEIIRKVQIETMSNLLAGATLLPPTAIERLKARTTPSLKAAQRSVYRTNIHACCLLHIHYLWDAYDPDVDFPLHDTFITYFPALAQRDPDLREKCDEALRTRPWNHDLTKDELAANAEAGRDAAQFMFDAAMYKEDPEGYCQKHGLNTTYPFEELFPPPDSKKIFEGIMRYIDMVAKSSLTLSWILAENTAPK